MSETRCNDLSPHLPNIVFFPPGLPLKAFKTRLLERSFHIPIKIVSFSSTTDVGSHNPPPFGASVLACTLSRVYPREVSTSLQKNVSFSSPTDVRSHNPPPLGPAFLLAHRLLSTPLRGKTFSLTHRPMSGSDTICNGPSPPLQILSFLGFSALPLKVFKTRLLGKKVSTLLQRMLRSLPQPIWDLTINLATFT